MRPVSLGRRRAAVLREGSSRRVLSLLLISGLLLCGCAGVYVGGGTGPSEDARTR
jgi:hypothetical protein